MVTSNQRRQELSIFFAFLGISYRFGQWRQRKGNNGHNYLIDYNKNTWTEYAVCTQ